MLTRISFFQKELEQNGIREGECVALIGDYSPNAILLMALLLNRNIVVPLSNESREKHLDMFEDAKVNQIIEINENDSWTLREGSESASHPLLDDLRERGVRHYYFHIGNLRQKQSIRVKRLGCLKNIKRRRENRCVRLFF